MLTSNFHGKGGHVAAVGLQCSRLWEFIQSGSPSTTARHQHEETGGLAAHLESGRLRIVNTPMDQELIAELNSFEVDFTSAGNMRVDVRSKDHHGDLVIATALALWLAGGRPSGKIEVGTLENRY